MVDKLKQIFSLQLYGEVFSLKCITLYIPIYVKFKLIFQILGVKSLPIHCVIEQTNGPLTFEPDNTATYNVELDTYAILPCTTLFSELLRTALVKLGYNANEAMNAKGFD